MSAPMVMTALLLTLHGETPTSGPGAGRDADCWVCHAGRGEEDAPKLDAEVYRRSSHGAEGCVGCHQDVLDPDLAHEEPDQDLAPVACGRCHEGAASTYGASVHAQAGEEELPVCASCHGSHEILPAAAADSLVHPTRQTATCGACHDLVRKAAGHLSDLSVPMMASATLEEEAALAELHDDAALVAAACADCHRAHDVRAIEDPEGPLHPGAAGETCGRCHDEVARAFEASAHSEATRAEDFRWDEEGGPPTCPTCHRMHGGSAPSDPRFRAELVNECGTCHEHLMESYVESYHGKATLLGSEIAAKCSDCHGSHRITGVDAPNSRIGPEGKLETCRRCHEGAPEGFASFYAHPSHDDPEGFAVLYWVFRFMSTLLISVLSFFGLHTLLWGIREAVDAIRLRHTPRVVHTGPRIQRFSPLDRFLHLLVVISFLGLAATGAPLKFARASWASTVFALMGGVESAGWWHRVFALITFVYFFTHLGQIAVRLWPRLRDGTLLQTLIGPDSLVPHPRDVVDVFRNMRWFVGLGPKPTWERWTYWEKFDYWAVFWGVGIIGTSGLILWFPLTFTHVLPGWLVNVALVVHSDEALLAIAFIFGVHFFNSHLRREKFPMDDVIFTGSMPAAAYAEERGREWSRLVAEDAAEGRYVPEPHPIFRAWVRVFGITAWLTGLVILILIIHGFLTTQT